MTEAVIDIETDSLNATKIHCIVARSYKTNKVKTWVGQECKDFGVWSNQIDTFIMHNGISFDAPVLNRLTGSNIKLNQVRDTLIESNYIILLEMMVIRLKHGAKILDISKVTSMTSQNIHQRCWSIVNVIQK